jgi:hypothetical protein
MQGVKVVTFFFESPIDVGQMIPILKFLLGWGLKRHERLEATAGLNAIWLDSESYCLPASLQLFWLCTTSRSPCT